MSEEVSPRRSVNGVVGEFKVSTTLARTGTVRLGTLRDFRAGMPFQNEIPVKKTNRCYSRTYGIST